MKLLRVLVAIVRCRAQSWLGLSDTEENPMKRIFALAFLFVSSVAYAQTTTTPAPTTPPPAPDTGGGLSWLWILVLLAIVAAAAWYFMKKRRDTTTASDVAGVTGMDRTAAGTGTTTTGTTGPTTPPAGPNVYSSKDPKGPKR
jgi:LPXTG-motif cell wall-anchored protein